MIQSLLIILFTVFLQIFVFGQRITRKPQSTPILVKPTIFEGRYFTVLLTNTDSVPVLLKLGPTKQIQNGDTLCLARTYPCSSPTAGEYYDLHDLVDQEDNCVRWYTLQQIKPRDSLKFIVKLKDYDKSDTSRFYYCYTREIKRTDKKLNLYDDPKKIYMMKESRDFETSFVAIGRNALNPGFAKAGLIIYISAANH